MIQKEDSNSLYIIGSVCGILSTFLYIIVIMVSFPAQISFSLAILWPLLGVIYAYALYRLVAIEQEGVLNRLSFIFPCLGFTIVAQMLSIQLALGFGI